ARRLRSWTTARFQKKRPAAGERWPRYRSRRWPRPGTSRGARWLRLPAAPDEKALVRLRIKGEETIEGGETGAVKLAHLLGGASARAGDDVRYSVAVHVADGYADAAGEARVIGEEAVDGLKRGGVEHFDLRRAAAAGARDDVVFAVAVHIAGCD